MSKKIPSTFKNMFLSLTAICLTMGLVLAKLNELTAGPIAEARAHRLQNAIRIVVPEFNNDPSAEAYWVHLETGDSVRVFPATMNGVPVGVAIHSFWQGWSGDDIQVMVGFDTEGNIYNYNVLHHTETPGLGDVMEPFFREEGNPRRNIIGRNPGEGLLRLVNDGGDIDAMTAATVTARAFLNAVNKAYAAFRDGYVDISLPEIELDLESAIKAIFPDFDNNPISKVGKISIDEGSYLYVFPATKAGENIGFAVHTFTDNGFGGVIHLMIGFDMSRNIVGYYIMYHNETPRWVEGMETWFSDEAYPQRNIINRNLSQGLLALTNDGGDIDIDGATGATVTARAMLEAINKAMMTLQPVMWGEPAAIGCY
jgi:electron transport complex protein RnfG